MFKHCLSGARISIRQEQGAIELVLGRSLLSVKPDVIAGTVLRSSNALERRKWGYPFDNKDQRSSLLKQSARQQQNANSKAWSLMFNLANTSNPDRHVAETRQGRARWQNNDEQAKYELVLTIALAPRRQNYFHCNTACNDCNARPNYTVTWTTQCNRKKLTNTSDFSPTRPWHRLKHSFTLNRLKLLLCPQLL